MIEGIAKQIWSASNDQKKCRIVLRGEPFPRVIAPLGICETSSHKIVLVCVQLAGFTKGGGEVGYRNLQLDRIKEVSVLEESFYKPDDFNPDDEQYHNWLFHIDQND